MRAHDLKPYCGHSVHDNGELSNLYDVIEELEGFVEQFSTHAMSEYELVLVGQLQAYQDVIDYLNRIAPRK